MTDYAMPAVRGGAGSEPGPTPITPRQPQFSPVIKGCHRPIGRPIVSEKDQIWFRDTLARRTATLLAPGAGVNEEAAVTA